MKKNAPRWLMSGTLMSLLLLGSACSWLATPPSDDPPPANTQESAAPPVQIMQTADSTWMVPAKKVQPVAAPPSATDMQTRLNLLEAQVAELHRDMGTMIPTLEKLTESQAQLQKMIAQMGQMQLNRTPVSSMQGTPMGAIAPPPTTSSYTAPPSQLPPGQLRPAPHDAPVQLAPQSVSPQAGDEDMSAPPADLAPPSAYPPSEQRSELAPGIAGNLYANTDYEQPPAPRAVQQQAAPQPAPQQMAANGGSSINQVRFGEHPDKTRMVLDVSDKVAFSYNVSPDGTVIGIDMAQTNWQGGQSAASSASPLVAAYAAQPDGKGGTHMDLQLRQPGKVVFAQYIPPSADHSPRIVVDIAPL